MSKEKKWFFVEEIQGEIKAKTEREAREKALKELKVFVNKMKEEDISIIECKRN